MKITERARIIIVYTHILTCLLILFLVVFYVTGMLFQMLLEDGRR